MVTHGSIIQTIVGECPQESHGSVSTCGTSLPAFVDSLKNDYCLKRTSGSNLYLLTNEECKLKPILLISVVVLAYNVILWFFVKSVNDFLQTTQIEDRVRIFSSKGN